MTPKCRCDARLGSTLVYQHVVNTASPSAKRTLRCILMAQQCLQMICHSLLPSPFDTVATDSVAHTCIVYFFQIVFLPPQKAQEGPYAAAAQCSAMPCSSSIFVWPCSWSCAQTAGLVQPPSVVGSCNHLPQLKVGNYTECRRCGYAGPRPATGAAGAWGWERSSPLLL